MTDDSTLGGYLDMHGRPPAFEGADGSAYSADILVDDTPDADGRFGAALMFVRWSESGERPVGHVETPYLARERTIEEARAALHRLTLHELKQQLDRAIVDSEERPAW